jgi:hemoglobin
MIRVPAMMLALTIGIALLGNAGCNHESKTEPAKKMEGSSLYERLGGEPAIAAVVDDFVARGASDPRVNFARVGTDKEWKPTPENVAKVKQGLVQFISQATGGPKNYHGKDMKSAHRGMKITDAQFNALAEDLKASLQKFGVGEKEQQELLAIVGSTRGDIVGQ